MIQAVACVPGDSDRLTEAKSSTRDKRRHASEHALPAWGDNGPAVHSLHQIHATQLQVPFPKLSIILFVRDDVTVRITRLFALGAARCCDAVPGTVIQPTSERRLYTLLPEG